MYNFYIESSSKKLIVSDLPQDSIKKRYRFKLELINTVRDKESIKLVLPRIQKSYPGYSLVEEFQKPRYVMTPEHKQALILSKLGKKRPEEVRKKISQTKKGKSNFEGKKHTYETKRLMAARKIGNQHNKNYVWAHNPDIDKEIMVKDMYSIPAGYSQGRDYYSTEPGLYVMNSRASNS